MQDRSGGDEFANLFRRIQTLEEEITGLRSRLATALAGSRIVASSIVGILPPSGGGTGYNVGSGPTIQPFVNNSGGSLADGDVVVVDTSGTRRITTTTSAGDVLAIGVVRDVNSAGSFANGAETPVMLLGNISTVKVTGAVAAGDYLEASGSAKLAQSAGSTPTAGVFAIAETAAVGPGAGTVSAFIFGVDNLGSSTGSGSGTVGPRGLRGPPGSPGRPIWAPGKPGLIAVRSYLSFGVNELAQANSNPTASHGADVYKASAQSIGNNSTTALQFDTELQDTDSYHDNVTNNTRLTVPSGLGGVYLIVGQGDWAANNNGRRIHDIRINGSTFINTNNTFVSSATNNAPSILVVALVSLVASDYVEMLAYQDSGGNLNCTPKLRMYRVG